MRMQLRKAVDRRCVPSDYIFGLARLRWSQGCIPARRRRTPKVDACRGRGPTNCGARISPMSRSGKAIFFYIFCCDLSDQYMWIKCTDQFAEPAPPFYVPINPGNEPTPARQIIGRSRPDGTTSPYPQSTHITLNAGRKSQQKSCFCAQSQ